MVYGGQLLFLFYIFAHFSILTINAQSLPLKHYCSNDNYTTADTNYQTNLKTILPSFYSNSNNIANRFGFYNVSLGESPDTVNAIGLCRGDVELNICRACLNGSYIALQLLCPSRKGAIGWYPNCLLKYSSRYILNTPESTPAFYLRSNTTVSNVEKLNLVLRGLLDRLKGEASAAGSIRKFATGNASGPGLSTVYVLVQCTPDISEVQCISCLDQAATEMYDCCDGEIRANIFTPSCILSYGPIRFFNNTPPILSTSPADAPSRPLPLAASSGKDNNTTRTILVNFVTPVISVILAAAILKWICSLVRKRKQTKPKEKIDVHEVATEHELDEVRRATDNFSAAATDSFPAAATEYDLEEIRLATVYFSPLNKLGQGSYGAVYKGTLNNGKRIAVKKLIRDSTQADRDLRNEVSVLAKLRHRNLVSLLGFCRDGPRILLIYELVANATLDNFIFGIPAKREGFNWDTLYKIIEGVARGLVYLHIDSQLQIIHRDLKPCNILLDKDMNPKIADFGTARLVLDATHRNTSKVIGTNGYMAPEYFNLGQYSVKTDVYSFGVILLEILTGKKNSQSPVADHPHDRNLLSYVWRNWQAKSIPDIIISELRTDPSSLHSIRRCIHIGLLCVQKEENDRPTMYSLSQWLPNQSITLPEPNMPAYVREIVKNNESNEYLTAPMREESPMSEESPIL